MFDFYNDDSDFEVTCEKENFDSWIDTEFMDARPAFCID